MRPQVSNNLRIAARAAGLSLLEIARDRTANLIFIGARGTRGLVHGELGGTAEQVIRSAQIPVVAVPTPPEL